MAATAARSLRLAQRLRALTRLGHRGATDAGVHVGVTDAEHGGVVGQRGPSRISRATGDGGARVHRRNRRGLAVGAGWSTRRRSVALVVTANACGAVTCVAVPNPWAAL